MRAIYILAFLMGVLARPALSQAPAHTDPSLQIAVDTAGIALAGPDVYITWVYAVAGPKSWPSSGILVAFDCRERKVKRLAHVMYKMKSDSSGVEGPIIEDNLPWVDVTIPALYDLVCKIGPTHGPSVVEPTKPMGRLIPRTAATLVGQRVRLT